MEFIFLYELHSNTDYFFSALFLLFWCKHNSFWHIMIPPYNDHRSLPVSHYGACIYFTRIQLTLPAASISETLFTKFFQGAARRAGITDTSVFLLGFDTIALQAEKTILLLTLKYILLH